MADAADAGAEAGAEALSAEAEVGSLGRGWSSSSRGRGSKEWQAIRGSSGSGSRLQ